VAQLKVTATAESDNLWKQSVATPFAAQAALFPFTETAEKDVAITDLSGFLNRKTGTLWTTEGQLGQLRSILVNGESLVALSKEHDQFMARMTLIRDALYSQKDREDRAVLPFEVGLGKFPKTSDVRFRISNNKPEISHKLLPDPNRPQPVEWSQDSCLGTTMSIEVSLVSDKLFAAAGQKPDREWGLFRLVRSGKISPGPTPKRVFFCDLEFPVKDVLAETLRARLAITVPDYEKSPFHPEFFRDIVCPVRVCE
jgi:type VI protein secretion system component VasK